MTVHIEINGDMAIESSATCWQLCRKRVKKNGSSVWQAFKFFNSFESCLREIMEMSVRNSNAKTVADLVRAYRIAAGEVKEISAPLKDLIAE